MNKYQWKKGMNEISGFGGQYEKACRKMLIAGLEYFDNHPDLDPQFRGFKNVYGIIVDDNDDAKKLSEAVTKIVPDCSGAMHQAVISHILWIRKNGWDNYVKEKSKKSNK